MEFEGVIIQNLVKDKEIEKIEKDAIKKFILGNFPLKELKKAGFFKDIRINNFEAVEKRINIFFGFESIFDYALLDPHHPSKR
jgi:HTH-type transcriptional regulator/antitoxin HigA